MGKRLSIEAYLTVEELEQRYRAARDAVARSQWQIIWLLGGGATSQEVAAVTGYSVPWIRELAKRYNRLGAAGIGDGRHRNPGPAPLLSAAQQQELGRVLDGPSPEGGRWSGPQVAVWMSGAVGYPVSAQRGWEYLRRLGFTPRVPRPRHAKADPAAQAAFKGGAGSSREDGPAGAPGRGGRAVDQRRAPPGAQADPATGVGAARPARAGAGPPPLSVDVSAGLCLPADRSDALVAAPHHQPAGV